MAGIETTELASKKLTLQKCLQKSFRNVFLLIDPLESALKQTLPKVESLANLMDQFECCSAIKSNVEPVCTTFPDLVPRLLAKIAEEILQITQDLTKAIIVIKETQEKFSKYHDVAMRLYHKCLTSVDFHTMTAVSPMTPSIADMMEWLEDADAQLYEHYYYKLHLLEDIVNKKVNSSNLVQKWTDQDQEIIKKIKDHLFFVKLFVEEDL
ncbi:uncharacterized protein C1orf109 homolog [Pomacea canaliculata]|uniref:uncharacterized protein C1orf109 homolog n=1 Tax=Pomacea canaliculata TaxID=400727 RepID=UPI000D72F1E7|nr:uncharacterized protein C1orf109 homolog [Pomacea canaliculata]